MPTQTFDESALIQCHCLALRRAARQINQFYDERLASTSLRATQFTLMSAVRLNEGLSVNELADILDLDRTTTGKNLLPLERLGYLQVSPSREDARSKALSLTPAGEEILKRAYKLWQQAQTEFERSNGRQMAETLRKTLASLK